MGHVVREKIARIARKIVHAAVATTSARWTKKRAAVVPVIAARVVAMVNATTMKRVRLA